MFEAADKCVQKNLILFMAEEDMTRGCNGRVAYLVGKRLGPACLRNKARRRLREVARLEGAPWPGARCLLVARNGADSREFTDLRRQLRKALSSLAGKKPGPTSMAAAVRTRRP